MASDSRPRSRIGNLFGLHRRSRESSAAGGRDSPVEAASTAPERSMHLSPDPPAYESVAATPVPSIDAPWQANNQLTIPVRSSTPIVRADTDGRDIWGQAALELDPRIIAKLKGIPQDENQASSEAIILSPDIDTVLELTKQRSKLEQDKIWKRRWNSLIKSISACKSLVDAGLQFDPTGYGALAWSVVSFGLQTAINNSDIQQAAYESSDYIRGVIEEYSMYEARYMETPSKGQSALRSCIIDVYKAVMNYAAELRYYLDHRSNRVAQAVRGLQLSSFVTFKATIEEKRAAARNIIYDIRSEFSESELAAIESKIESALILARQISRVTKYVSRKEDEDVLRWVSDVKMGVAHQTQRNYAVAKGREKPGIWILNETAYLNWDAAERSSTLWLSGGVGTGKTILTSTVIEDRNGIYGKDALGPIAFFYCSGIPGNGQRSVTAETILGSILRQIAESSDHGLSFVRTKWEAEHKLRSLTQVEVMSLIRQIIEHEDTLEVTIIVDGLDELDAESLNGLLGSLAELQSAAGILKIFAASRWVQRVEDFLGEGFRIRNSPESTRSDLDLYIDTTVDAQLKGRRGLEECLGTDIKTTLKERAKGMFRYVELAMKFIFDKSTRLIRQRLEELPEPSFGDAGLRPIYQKLYDLIENDDEMSRLLAHRTIQWLLYQIRPLESHDMIKGICLDAAGPTAKKLHEQHQRHKITKEEVYAACHHLVIHNDATGSFEFGHFSVVEFLTWLNAPTFRKPIAHSTLSVACLLVLISKSYQDEATSWPGTLNNYALASWGWHCRNSKDTQEHDPFKDLLAKFWDKGDYLNCSLATAGLFIQRMQFTWLRTGEGNSGSNLVKLNMIWAALNPEVVAQTPKSLQQWLVACAFDLVALVKDLLQNNRNFKSVHSKIFLVGFKLAFHCGSVNIVQYLLDRYIDSNSLETGGYTMLHHAANSLSVESLKLYLQKSPASINSVAMGAYKDLWKTTPLIMALGSMNYYTELGDKEVIRTLLSAPGLDFHATGFSGETAMHMLMSSFAVGPDIVEVALKNCASSIYRRDPNGTTPMAIARDRADKSGDLSNIYISDGWAELARLERYAILFTYDASKKLQLLLSVEQPLHAAARTGDLDELKELVGRDGWKEESRSQDLLTALFLAAENGNVNSTQFLLDTGFIDVNAQDRDGFSTLMVATLGRPASPRVIRLLRSRGASVTLETTRGKNAFYFAIEKGNLETVKALLSFVANSEMDVNHRDSVTGSTPLHYAHEKKIHPALAWSSERQTDLVNLLLENHARIDIKNKKGQTPRQVAEANAKLWRERSLSDVEEQQQVTIGSWSSFAPISEISLLLKKVYNIT